MLQGQFVIPFLFPRYEAAILDRYQPFIKGQKLHGRTKLTLSNAFLDFFFMKAKLGDELYHTTGLATPGVGWANVILTVEGMMGKKLLGLYVIIAQVNNRYLESILGGASKVAC